MDASLEVIAISGYHDQEAQGTAAPSIGLRVHCRITTTQESSERQRFDVATVTLLGVIQSSIGTRVTTQSILEISKRRTWRSFEPYLNAKISSANQNYSDIVFSLPLHAHDSLLPSMSMSGSTHVTRSAVLSDQHLVQGYCEVSYWVEAELELKGSLVRRLRQPLYIRKATVPYLLVPSPLSSRYCNFAARPHATSLLKKGWPFKGKSSLTPRINVEVGEQWTTSLKSKVQIVCIQLTICMHLSLLYDNVYPIDEMLQNGIRDCAVEAKWHERQLFANGGLLINFPDRYDGSPQLKISRDTVAEQKTAVSFPPFYQDDDCAKNSKNPPFAKLTTFSTTAILELVLPESVCSPTANTDLLKISYIMNLSLSFQQVCASWTKLPWTANTKIPLNVEMA